MHNGQAGNQVCINLHPIFIQPGTPTAAAGVLRCLLLSSWVQAQVHEGLHCVLDGALQGDVAPRLLATEAQLFQRLAGIHMKRIAT